MNETKNLTKEYMITLSRQFLEEITLIKRIHYEYIWVE